MRKCAAQTDLSWLPPETYKEGASLEAVITGYLDPGPDTRLTAHKANTMLFFLTCENSWVFVEAPALRQWAAASPALCFPVVGVRQMQMCIRAHHLLTLLTFAAAHHSFIHAQPNDKQL